MDVEVNEGPSEERGMTRRQMLVRTAAAGATLAWVVPAVEAATAGVAGASPIPQFNSPFDYELAFTIVDPDQNNGEGYFWAFLAAVDINGNLVELDYGGVGSGPMVGGNQTYGVTSIDGGIPPINGGLAASPFNGSGGSGPAPQGQYSNYVLAGNTATIDLNPPAGVSNGETAAGGFYPLHMTLTWDPTTLDFTVTLEPDEVSNNLETNGGNFPDPFIYGMDLIHGTTTHQVSYLSNVSTTNTPSYLAYNTDPGGSLTYGSTITFNTTTSPSSLNYTIHAPS